MLERSVASTVFAQWACQLFPLLRGPDNLNALLNFVEREERTPARGYMIEDARWPKCAVIRCGVHMLLVINCTESLRQAANLMAGYIIPQTGHYGSRVRNNQLWSGSRWIIEHGDPLPTWQTDVKIIGHSQGGAIAAWLARELKDERPTLQIGVLSFGAPKVAGDQYILADNNRFAIVRYMNDGDPVPSIPYVSDMNLAATLIAPSAVSTSSSFSQHWGGRRLDANGDLRSYSSQPSDALVPNLSDFSGWLYETELGRDTPHTINAYADRLALYNANHPPLLANNIPNVRPDRPIVIPRAEAVRAANVQAVTMFNAGGEQQRARLVQPPRTVFYATRKGRVWSVYLGDKQVAIGPTKKRARGLARIGNAFLARLQRSAFVDQATIVGEVSSVLLQMSDPASGFRPPLRIEMPVAPPFQLRGR